MPNGFSMQVEADKEKAKQLEELASKQTSSTERLRMQEEARRLRRESSNSESYYEYDYD